MCPNCDNHTGNPKPPLQSKPDRYIIKNTHCPKGHEYTEDNCLWHRNGERISLRCRECERIRARDKWKKHKQQ